MSEELENYKQELRDIAAYINDENTRILAGEERDLSGLDDRVNLACTKIETLPKDLTSQVEPEMAQMISALENIALTLQAKSD